MATSWVIKKQLTFLIVFALLIIVALFLVWMATNESTCFDGKQNQEEAGIDCGGPCDACVGEVKDLIVVWSKPFKLTDGRYDVAALVENPNLFAGLSSLRYQFKLYDKNNILIAVRDGETFINQGEQYVVFETNIDVGERNPARAFIELDPNPRWTRVEREIPQIIISKKSFTNEPFPRLSAEVSNKSLFTVDSIRAIAVLYGDENNAVGVSSTKINSIQGGASRQIVFTWPAIFQEEPIATKIFLRTNLTGND